MKKILSSSNCSLSTSLEMSELESRLETMLIAPVLIDMFGKSGEADPCDRFNPYCSGDCNHNHGCDDTCDNNGSCDVKSGGCDWDCDDLKP